MSTTPHKILIFFLYVASYGGILLLGPDDLTSANMAGIGLIFLAVLGNDLVSFDQGIRTGINISNDALKRVCDEKQITITRK